MTSSTHYESILSERYASREMSYLFSPHFKYTTWRKLWVALAKAEHSLGLAITESQIQSMEAAVDSLDIEKANTYEKELRHDVMAHLYAFADQCPEARSILHLGATSCYITDNTDLIQMKEALQLILNKIVQVLRHLHAFAQKYAGLPCLSYTHLQAAQPTTVGKRACLWIQDLLMDFQEIERCIENLKFLGVKGATGTQASFLSLFEGDLHKVKKMEAYIAKEMGFLHVFPISGQTYTRKQDIQVLSLLASFAASIHKMATDLRLLAHLKEIEEPFAEKQIGSSAMPYKRNPMRSERISGIARFLISLAQNPLYTEATQWLERTLDDSSNRRLCLPEAFLAADAILDLLCNITKNLIVHPKMIEKHLKEEIPFLATEPILMKAVQKGKNRQHVHERLRIHSLSCSQAIKEEGKDNQLLEHILNDVEIGISPEELKELMHIENFIGCAKEQTEDFLKSNIFPLLQKHIHLPNYTAQIVV